MSLEPPWVHTWAADITAQLQYVLSAFDRYYPFPPGRNEVVLADPEHSSIDAARIPPDLITFYGVIHEVIMSDIGNGYFIHPPPDAVTPLGDDTTGAVFASNGGGTLYAISPDNRVHRSHAASPDSGFEPIATDLQGFLEQLRDAVADFVSRGR